MTQSHTLPELPYPLDALEPYISKQTLSFHYGKHHAAYVDKLNKAVQETPFFGKTLEEIIASAQGPIFNNAAQAWNHAFYWRCLSPNGGDESENKIIQAIERDFKTLQDFKQSFTDAAASLFGSGWTWLVMNKNGKLKIINTQNADTPLSLGHTPLLVCDVWEHAYYLDYQNARPDYLQAFWKLVDWEFVNEQFIAVEALLSQHSSQAKRSNQ